MEELEPPRSPTLGVPGLLLPLFKPLRAPTPHGARQHAHGAPVPFLHMMRAVCALECWADHGSLQTLARRAAIVVVFNISAFRLGMWRDATIP